MNSNSDPLGPIQGKYHIEFPLSFKKLISVLPFTEGTYCDLGLGIGDCGFFGLKDLLSERLRFGDVPTGLFPFGRRNGDEFCFYFGHEYNNFEPPIVIYHMDTKDLFPIASSLRGLLWFELLKEEVYASEYDNSAVFTDAEKRDHRDIIARIPRALGISYEIGSKLNPDRKEDWPNVHMEFLKVDPTAPQSLCWVGKRYLEKGDLASAAEYIERSCHSAPYLAAPYYFLAEIRNMEGKKKEALELYWQASGRPLCSSGQTYWMEFDLGVGIEGFSNQKDTISAKAFAALREEESILFDIADGDPRADYIITCDDPADQEGRIELAREYQGLNELEKAAAEWSNVLYLSWYNDGAGTSLAIESLIEIHKELKHDWAVAMHRDPTFH